MVIFSPCGIIEHKGAFPLARTGGFTEQESMFYLRTGDEIISLIRYLFLKS